MRLGQTSFVSFVSQVVASVAGFAATLFITQNLGDAVFGRYMLFVAAVIWLQVVGLLGVESALTQRLSRVTNRSEYLTVGAVIGLFAFLVISSVLVLLRGQVTAYLGAARIWPLVVLLFAGLLFAFVRAVLSGEHQVHIAGLLQPLNVATRSGIQITVVLTSAGFVGLLAGHALGNLLAALVGLLFVSTGLTVPRRETFGDVLGYARYSWLGKLGSRAFSAMDTLILGLFVAKGLIGVYEAAWNLASILAVFGTAISQAAFPEISRADSADEDGYIKGVLDDALTFTGLLLIPGAVGSLIIGSRVMGIYGPEFTRGGTILVLLVVARLVYAYGEQFIAVLGAIDRPDLSFNVNAVFLVTNVAGNFVLVYAIGWYGAAIATALSAVAALVVAYRYTDVLVGIDLPLGELGKQLGAAAVMGGFVLVGDTNVAGGIVVTIVLVSVGGLLYFGTLVVVSRRFRATVRRNLPA